MASEKAFKEVLSFVAKSKLNFTIFQTPFSAQLSLKKSFAKHFHANSGREFVEVHEEQDESDVCVLKDTIKEMENRLSTVNLENFRLKKAIEENEDSMLGEEVTFFSTIFGKVKLSSSTRRP